jgi:DNA-directed RNA polymerase subunit alpha
MAATATTALTEFQVPQISREKADDTSGTFVIEPLDKGFGYTFGNSLRRVLLSSLGGAAIKSVRIEGVAHEFSTIPGVKEDVTDLVLNLKDVVIRMHTDADEVEVPLVASGPGKVTAKDIDLPAGVEVLNPNAPIATLEKRTKLEMYLTVGRGRGYSPAEENKTEDQPIGVVPIDSIFSPIRRAAYSVDSARVGQRTDFDKLTLEVETDGSIEPGSAVREAAEILIKSLAIFTDADRVEELTSRDGAAVAEAVAATAGAGAEGDDRLIEELEIGVRAYNCLKRAGIQTIGDLVQKSDSELKAIPNFGERSIDEVKEALTALGLSLRDE